MAALFHIDRDVPCVKCSYNLRGLSTDGNCPECGTALDNALVGILVNPKHEYYGVVRRMVLKRKKLIADELGYPVAAMEFVKRVLVHARKIEQRARNKPYRAPGVQFSAKIICESLWKCAIERARHPAAAPSLLRVWGINSSEDLGKIIANMASAGLINPADAPAEVDFVGMFKIDELPRNTIKK